MKESRVAILYWGTRGGPVRQLTNLIDASVAANIDLHWFMSANIQGLKNLTSLPDDRIHISKLPKSKYGLIFLPFKRHKIASETIARMHASGISRVFFLLPHPWDIYLAKRLIKTTGIEVVRGIHDLKRHPGDIWPTKRAIKDTLKFAHRFVAFSSYIADLLHSLDKQVQLTSIYEVQKNKKQNISDHSVLFIGRIRKYKGLDLLREAWTLVESKEKKLTIAGDGQGIPFKPDAQIRVINEWLTDDRIEELIDDHQLIVLPYTEASQSGIIPIAHAHGKPVVVTPVGGLKTQIFPYLNGIIAESVTPKSLALAIDSALRMTWNIKASENDLKTFLKSLID